MEAFLVAQISDLQKLLARAERGDLAFKDRIAVAISEDVLKQFLDASLPREVTVAERVRVRIESAQPFFRGNNAAVVFQAVARGLEADTPEARLEIGGSLERVRIERGTLIADVQMAHFTVIGTSLGEMAAGTLEAMVRENAGAITALLPAVEIPVRLEQSVEIEGFSAGGVSAGAGSLPLQITVAEVIPVSQRLWVLLDARAGTWQGVEPEGLR